MFKVCSLKFIVRKLRLRMRLRMRLRLRWSMEFIVYSS